MVPVVHLTTEDGAALACQNPALLTGGTRPKTLFLKFDALMSLWWRSFSRSGSIYAYPDLASIDRSRIGTMHQGEVAVLLFVDPNKTFVADALFVDRAGRVPDLTAFLMRHSGARGNCAWGEEPNYAAEALAYDEAQKAVNNGREPLAEQYFMTALTLMEYNEKLATRLSRPFVFPEVVIPAGSQMFIAENPVKLDLDYREIEEWEIELRKESFSIYKLPSARNHPWGHTLEVVNLAAELAQIECPEHKKAAIIAAFIHDLGRESDGSDPEHARRSAELGKSIVNRFNLTEIEVKTIEFAVLHHADRKAPNGGFPIIENYSEVGGWGLIKELIAVLWDADRLQLIRLQDEVDINYLCTDSAKEFAKRKKISSPLAVGR